MWYCIGRYRYTAGKCPYASLPHSSHIPGDMPKAAASSRVPQLQASCRCCSLSCVWLAHVAPGIPLSRSSKECVHLPLSLPPVCVQSVMIVYRRPLLIRPGHILLNSLSATGKQAFFHEVQRTAEIPTQPLLEGNSLSNMSTSVSDMAMSCKTGSRVLEGF